jgi:hypothetical protein
MGTVLLERVLDALDLPRSQPLHADDAHLLA